MLEQCETNCWMFGQNRWEAEGESTNFMNFVFSARAFLFGKKIKPQAFQDEISTALRSEDLTCVLSVLQV